MILIKPSIQTRRGQHKVDYVYIHIYRNNRLTLKIETNKARATNIENHSSIIHYMQQRTDYHERLRITQF